MSDTKPFTYTIKLKDNMYNTNPITYNNEFFKECSNFKSSDSGISEIYTKCTFININFLVYDVRESRFDDCVFINCDFTTELEKIFTNPIIIGCRRYTIKSERITNDIT